MLRQIEDKNQILLDKHITYIDINIIDDVILKSRCFNGGGHLLNIGNFSRLLVGEIYDYDKLIYLDADSIVQYDLFNKLHKTLQKFPTFSWY